MIDVYYLKEYGEVWAEYEQAKFEEFVYQEGKNKVIYPFLRRRLEGGWTDLVSPYGYSGPWSNSEDLNFYKRFRQAFTADCQKKKVVSEFIRFHPLLNTQRWAVGLIPCQKREETVWIDLTQPETALWQGLRKGHQSSIKKAQKGGIKVKPALAENITQFYQLYRQTMIRKKAEKYYLFSEKFFKEFFRRLESSIFWLGAYENKNLVAGSIFLKSDQFLHYHFAATAQSHLVLSPGTLILWEAVKLGKHLGLKKFHLGGGIDKNLAFYKQGFSQNRAEFYSGEVIHNQAVYNRLCQKAKITKGHYFPLYRQPKT